jgi:hypothetical protein
MINIEIAYFYNWKLGLVVLYIAYLSFVYTENGDYVRKKNMHANLLERRSQFIVGSPEQVVASWLRSLAKSAYVRRAD